MTRENHDADGTNRLGTSTGQDTRHDSTPTGSHSGADVTSRMTGTDRADRADQDRTTDGTTDRTDRDATDHDRTDRDRDLDGTGRHRGDHAAPVTTGADHERYEERVVPTKYKSAKTSAAATFALVFGLAALFSALTAILAPAALLFGLIGIVLGIVGLKMAKRVGVTGKGVAIGGLVTAVLGLALGAAVLAGASVYVNEEGLDRVQQQIDRAVENAPTGREIVESVPGTN